MEDKLRAMISQPAKPDPIDVLLDKISHDAELEQSQKLATFFQRAVARVIDTTAVIGIAYGAQLYFDQYIRTHNTMNIDYIVKSANQAMPAFALIFWVIVYSPVLEGTGGTIGKRLMRIQLVDLNTRVIPPFRMCTARAWIYLVFVVLLFVPAILSCLAFFVSDYHQTWHDKLTNMICVKKK